MNDIFYVYVYLDPRKEKFESNGISFEHEPFYIGKGKDKRAWQHLFESQRKQHGKNSLKLQKIERIINSGHIPKIYFFKENISEEEAMELEKSLISKIGTKWCIKGIKRGPLTNMTSGGDGYTPSDELCKKHSMPGIKNPMYGKTHTAEAKEKIRKQSLKLKHSNKTKKQMSKIRGYGGTDFRGFKWILITPEGKRIKIDHLSDYCKKEKLPYGSLYGSFRRKKPIGTYRNKSKYDGYQLIRDDSN